MADRRGSLGVAPDSPTNASSTVGRPPEAALSVTEAALSVTEAALSVTEEALSHATDDAGARHEAPRGGDLGDLDEDMTALSPDAGEPAH